MSQQVPDNRLPVIEVQREGEGAVGVEAGSTGASFNHLGQLEQLRLSAVVLREIDKVVAAVGDGHGVIVAVLVAKVGRVGAVGVIFHAFEDRTHRAGRRKHLNRDGSSVSQRAVADRVGEAIVAAEVRVWRVGQCVSIVDHRAVGGVRCIVDGKAFVGVGIAIVRQHIELNGGVLDSLGAVILGFGHVQDVDLERGAIGNRLAKYAARRGRVRQRVLRASRDLIGRLAGQRFIDVQLIEGAVRELAAQERIGDRDVLQRDVARVGDVELIGDGVALVRLGGPALGKGQGWLDAEVADGDLFNVAGFDRDRLGYAIGGQPATVFR